MGFHPNTGGGGSGDVVGPVSSTDNVLVRFDGATGKLIQGSIFTLSDIGLLVSTGAIALEDINKTGSTWTGALVLSSVTNEWDNYKAEFGQVSLLSAIVTAATTGAGDVVGPASSTDNEIVRYDGVTGKLIKDSGIVTLSAGGGFLSSGAIAIQSSNNGEVFIISDDVLDLSDGFKAGSTYASALTLSANTGEWDLFETNFGEVSILNAISQAAASGNTLDGAYDFGGAGSGRSITADSGAVEITVPDTSNNAGMIINQNDTTNNPQGLEIVNDGAGEGLNITMNGTGDAINLFGDGTVEAWNVNLEIRTAGTGNIVISSVAQISIADNNKAGSTYAGPMWFSAASAEWDLFETNYGEVSLLNAINQAAGGGGGTLDASYDFGGAGAGRTITVDAGAVQLQPDATTQALHVDAATTDQTHTTGVVHFEIDSAADNVIGVLNEFTATGDFAGCVANKISITSGGMLNANDFAFANFVAVNPNAADVANTSNVGHFTVLESSPGGVGSFLGMGALAASFIPVGVAYNETGDATGVLSIIEHTGGTGDLSGAQIQVVNNTNPVGSMVGLSIAIQPDVVGFTSASGLIITNSGSQTADTAITEAGAFSQGINLNGTHTTAIAISGTNTLAVNVGVGSGASNFQPRVTIGNLGTTAPLNITEVNTAPTVPASNDIYVDDGTNTASGSPGWRRYTGAAWEDMGALGGGGGGNTLNAAYDQGGAGAGRIITVDSGAVELQPNVAQQAFLVDATTGAVTHTNGVARVTSTTATANVTGIVSDFSTTVAVEGTAAFYGTHQNKAGGGAGASSFVYTASLQGHASDTNHIYVAYNAETFKSTGGTSTSYAIQVGDSYDYALHSAYAMVIGVTGADLTLETNSSGDLVFNSAGEILFSDVNKGASGYAGDFKLSETLAEWNTFESNFGEVSLLNAINQASSGGGNTLDQAYDQGGAGAGRTITASDGAVLIQVLDTNNNMPLALTQLDVTNNPVVLSIQNSGTGADIFFNTTGYLFASNGNLKLENATSGDIILDSVGDIVLDPASNVIDLLTGNIAITNASGTITLQTTTAGNVVLAPFTNLILSDGFKSGSGYASDFQLSDGSAEWNTYENFFGEVSLLDGIVQAAGQDLDNVLLNGNITGGTDIALSGGDKITGVATGNIVLQNTTSGDIHLLALTDLVFSDGNKAGSTYATELLLSDNSGEWDTFEANFGEVSLLNAINQAAGGAAGSLAATLAVGNTTGGTDIEVTSGDSITASGSNLPLTTTTSGIISLNSAGSVSIDAAAANTIVINNNAVDVDTTIKGNTDISLLVVDAGNDRVGISTPTPGGLFEVANSTTTHGLYVNQTAVLSANNYAAWIYSNAAQTNASTLFFVEQDNASSTANAATIQNDGTGFALQIIQNTNVAASKNSLEVTSSVAQTNNPLVGFAQLNASSTVEVLALENDGIGSSLYINHDNSGACISLDQDANNASVCAGIAMNLVNAGAGTEYAFAFDGSEYVSSAVGGTQDRKIRVRIGGTTYYIPAYTT